jgi:hypothetical protein
VPTILHFDAKNNVLRHTYQGRLTDAALIEGYTKASNYLAIHHHKRIITDFSDVTSIEVTSQTIRALASSPSKIPHGCERIFVVPQNALYGLARMFQILVEKSRPNLNVVRSMAEAHRLMGIESAEFNLIDSQDLVEDQSA